jgi:ribosomal protein L11
MVNFRTVLLQKGNNIGIEVPEEIVLSFGAGKRVPVVVTVDGDYSYRNTISSMGGRYLISFNADTRAKTGRGGGDEVKITLEHDTAPRTVEMPDALAEALGDDPAAHAAWARLAPSQQKEQARTIAEAKGDDTRARRVAKAVELLRG